MRIELTTLLFETINFLVLMLVLRKLLYQPLRRGLQERRAALVAEQQAAVDAREQAEQMRAEYETQRSQLGTLQEQTRTQALEEAVAERARMLTQAREEAAAERAHVQRLLESERRAAEDWVRSVAIERSTQLAGQMLLELAPQAVNAALQARLWRELEHDLHGNAALRDSSRQGVEVEVEVIGAELPSDNMLQPLQDLLRRVLAKPVSLSVRIDPSLIAGLVVRVGDRAYDASVAGQLDALRGVARELLEGARAHG